MVDRGPRPTQSALFPTVVAESASTGLEDAHEIGRGGYGVAFSLSPELPGPNGGRQSPTSNLDPDNFDRFMREQRPMGRLSGHPNIVNILTVGATYSGLPYMVMPHYPNDSLDVRIRRDEPRWSAAKPCAWA